METYLIPVEETIKEAWSKVKGTKASVWAGIGILILITVGFAILEHIVKNISFLFYFLMIIDKVVVFLLEYGLIYIGIQRAFDLPITYRQIFRSLEFRVAISIIGYFILLLLIFIIFTSFSFIGFVIYNAEFTGKTFFAVLIFLIANIGLIYINVRLILALPLILDKKVNPWVAIKKSFEGTQSNFWRLLALSLIQFLAFFIGVITLLIGLIWILPFNLICYGVIYKKLLINIRSQ